MSRKHIAVAGGVGFLVAAAGFGIVLMVKHDGGSSGTTPPSKSAGESGAVALQAPPAPPDAAPEPFGRCTGDYPRILTVLYLRSSSRIEAPADMLTWFDGIAGRQVSIDGLELANGKRVVAFQLTPDSWDEWSRIAGSSTGINLCRTISANLIGRRVGRPDALRAGNPNYDFVDKRAPSTKVVPFGTLADLTQPYSFARMKDWLWPPEKATACRFVKASDSYVDMSCSVTNTRTATETFIVTGTISGNTAIPRLRS